jgi:GrpB-like predicted nucleotidyltransferase (UPF0157 family)
VFRDYCRTHPDVARDDEAHKRKLAIDHRHERARYAEGKAAFIQAVLRRAHAD